MFLRVYDAYVTMGELMKVPAPAGQQALGSVMGAFQSQTVISPEEREARLIDEDLEDDAAMDYAAMGKDMPLICLTDNENAK